MDRFLFWYGNFAVLGWEISVPDPLGGAPRGALGRCWPRGGAHGEPWAARGALGSAEEGGAGAGAQVSRAQGGKGPAWGGWGIPREP